MTLIKELEEQIRLNQRFPEISCADAFDRLLLANQAVIMKALQELLKKEVTK